MGRQATLPGVKPPPSEFDGETYDPEYDRKRLGRQLQAVFDLMQDGAWRTLEEIQGILERSGIRAMTTNLSARMRDFRKPEYGKHESNKRRRRPACAGIYEYQLVIRK